MDYAQAMTDGLKGLMLPLDLHDKKTLDPLMERIGDARIVMLGEASHGVGG
jgi:erythromycin esterase-like protein